MTRRQLFALFGALGFAPPAANAQLEPGGAHPDPRRLSDARWRERLSPAQYRVLRREGTEPSHSSPLDREKRQGVYECAGCGVALFTSAMKFDSGTGWPSFHTALPDAVATKTDFKAVFPRTEYHCAHCGGHQGHVFDDGPPATGKRYCNNGIALNFVAAAAS